MPVFAAEVASEPPLPPGADSDSNPRRIHRMSLRNLMQEGSSKVNDLFARLSDTSEGAVKTREKLFNELKAELELHANLEEEFLFPLLRKNPETRGLVVEAIADNKNLRARLTELEALPTNGEALLTPLTELQKP